MCMKDSILSGVIIRQSRAARILGGGGWPTRKFIGATGINPVTYNNKFKHLATLGHKWVTNAVDLDNKTKKKLGVCLARATPVSGCGVYIIIQPLQQ